MRVIVQRVSKASVSVENEIKGQIENGFLLLVGMTHTDTKEIVEKMADKVANLRVFEDEQGKLNLSIDQIKGAILSISQFTLYADCKKGRRPSFIEAARPQQANELYIYFNEQLSDKNIQVETGVFQTEMNVELTNQGPVTIILDSDTLF